MWFLLGPGGGGGNAVKTHGPTDTERYPSPLCVCAEIRPTLGSPRGTPAPRPRPWGPAIAPGALRPRAGGTESSVKAQRAGERNMALGSSMCKIRKELQ